MAAHYPSKAQVVSNLRDAVQAIDSSKVPHNQAYQQHRETILSAYAETVRKQQDADNDRARDLKAIQIKLSEAAVLQQKQAADLKAAKAQLTIIQQTDPAGETVVSVIAAFEQANIQLKAISVTQQAQEKALKSICDQLEEVHRKDEALATSHTERVELSDKQAKEAVALKAVLKQLTKLGEKQADDVQALASLATELGVQANAAQAQHDYEAFFEATWAQVIMIVKSLEENVITQQDALLEIAQIIKSKQEYDALLEDRLDKISFLALLEEFSEEMQLFEQIMLAMQRKLEQVEIDEDEEVRGALNRALQKLQDLMQEQALALELAAEQSSHDMNEELRELSAQEMLAIEEAERELQSLEKEASQLQDKLSELQRLIDKDENEYQEKLKALKAREADEVQQAKLQVFEENKPALIGIIQESKHKQVLRTQLRNYLERKKHAQWKRDKPWRIKALEAKAMGKKYTKKDKRALKKDWLAVSEAEIDQISDTELEKFARADISRFEFAIKAAAMDATEEAAYLVKQASRKKRLKLQKMLKKRGKKQREKRKDLQPEGELSTAPEVAVDKMPHAGQVPNLEKHEKPRDEDDSAKDVAVQKPVDIVTTQANLPEDSSAFYSEPAPVSERLKGDLDDPDAPDNEEAENHHAPAYDPALDALKGEDFDDDDEEVLIDDIELEDYDEALEQEDVGRDFLADIETGAYHQGGHDADGMRAEDGEVTQETIDKVAKLKQLLETRYARGAALQQSRESNREAVQAFAIAGQVASQRSTRRISEIHDQYQVRMKDNHSQLGAFQRRKTVVEQHIHERRQTIVVRPDGITAQSLDGSIRGRSRRNS